MRAPDPPGPLTVTVEDVVQPLRVPLRAAWGELRERRLLALELIDSDGVRGRGEAAPLEGYDGVSLAACREQLEQAACELRAGTHPVLALPQAAAAVDLALWDLAGRRAGRPVWSLLGAAAGGRVAVNATIGALDRAGAANAAAAACAAGFRCVKVKVGVEDDAGRVAAVRAALGPGVALRLDANGAWDVEGALAALPVLAPAGIELCEEPVHGVDAMRAVRAAAPVPVALDESASAPGALTAGVADLACLKIAACGGIGGLLEAAACARAASIEVYLGSSFDGPLGIAAALHVAAALGTPRPSGLATLSHFADLDDPFPPCAGAIVVPTEPGLGA